MLSIKTVVCFNTLECTAYQFVEACIESKQSPTFQCHANAVLAKMEDFTSWEDVKKSLLSNQKERLIDKLFALEKRILDTREAIGLDVATSTHAHQLGELYDMQLRYMNEYDVKNVNRVHAEYVAMCKK